MKFNSLLVVVAAACSAQVVKAIDWGTICSEPDFGGTCTTYQSSSIGKCVNFTGKDSFWNDKISSLSVVNPFGGNFRVKCTFFTAAPCSGQAVDFQPGRFSTVNPNDQFSSFRCTTVSLGPRRPLE